MCCVARPTRVAVVYGGASPEHPISLQSAAYVINHLDRTRHLVLPIRIHTHGGWALDTPALEAWTREQPVALSPVPPGPEPSGAFGALQAVMALDFDVLFPVLHGSHGEDGSIQGLCQMLNVPCVGASLGASAVGMDKVLAKQLASQAGIPVSPFATTHASSWQAHPQEVIHQMQTALPFPVFVKPSRAGSSLGVNHVATPGALGEAIEQALQYDPHILVEQALPAREIELAVLAPASSHEPPWISMPGEIALRDPSAFYSYHNKYVDTDAAILHVPATLSESLSQHVRHMTQQAWTALGRPSIARVDWLLHRDTNQFFFNEINTLPGFTPISMFPQLMRHGGIPSVDWLTRLVQGA